MRMSRNVCAAECERVSTNHREADLQPPADENKTNEVAQYYRDKLVDGRLGGGRSMTVEVEV
jgi:hypothetical protein